MTVRSNFHKIPSPSEESRAAKASLGVDPCEGMAKPAAGDVSDSQHGLSIALDERAFAAAEERFRDTYHTTYREGSRWGDCEQAHYEATQEALEAFLGCYLEETGRCEGTGRETF